MNKFHGCANQEQHFVMSVIIQQYIDVFDLYSIAKRFEFSLHEIADTVIKGMPAIDLRKFIPQEASLTSMRQYISNAKSGNTTNIVETSQAIAVISALKQNKGFDLPIDETLVKILIKMFYSQKVKHLISESKFYVVQETRKNIVFIKTFKIEVL